MSGINRLSGMPQKPISPEAPTQQAEKKDPKVWGAAQLYEQQFLREIVKAMRRSVPESELVPTSMGERIYREQLDDQYVDQWSQKGGVGFADLVYDHIMERFIRPSRMERPQNPIPIEKAKVLKPIETQKGPSSSGRLHLELSPQAGARDLVAPWEGEVKGVNRAGSGHTHLVLEHSTGLKSEFLFDGVSSIGPGKKVHTGERLGLVSPDASSLFWILSRS